MTKKYELTDDVMEYEGRTLHRIRALVDFVTYSGEKIHKGDLGGWVSGEHNLSHEGSCWIADEAVVCDEAVACNKADISGYATIYGSACVDKGIVSDEVKIGDEAYVSVGYASCVYDEAKIYGKACVSVEKTEICGETEIYGNANVFGRCEMICGSTKIYDNARVNSSVLPENAQICGDMKIEHKDCSKEDIKDMLEQSVECIDRGSEKHSPTKNQERL